MTVQHYKLNMKPFIQGSLLEDVKLCLQISYLGGGLAFQWNKTLNQLEVKCKLSRYALGIRLGIATFYLIVQFIQASTVLNGASPMVITHSIMYIICTAHILSCEHVNFIKLSGVVQLFNGFIQIEQNFAKYFGNTKIGNGQNAKVNNLFIRGMMYLLTTTGVFYPILYAADILRNPCFPAYAGYRMSSQCLDKPGYYLEPTWSLEEVLTKLVLASYTYLIMAPFIAGWLFIMCLEYVVEGNFFRVGITQFGK